MTTPNVSVTATPMSQWTNPAPATNYNMGTVNLNSGASTSPSGTTSNSTNTNSNTGSSTNTGSTPIVTNSSGTGSALASSAVSSAMDSNTLFDVNKANVDTTTQTNNYNNYISLLDKQISDLETRRQDQIKSINSSFDVSATNLKNNQASETGTYTSTLARMGGYLGNTASATGTMVNLANTQRAQVADLESKRTAALQLANSAIDDKQFDLARQKLTEAKDYAKSIQDAKQAFFNNNKAVIENQQKGMKDSAIAKLYSEGTTDPTSIISALQSTGIYATAEDISKTISSLVPPAVSDLVKILDKYGAPGDVKLKVLNSKNVNEAYSNAGVWANLGGDGEIGKYNYYVATQKTAGKPYVDPMTFFNQDQILKNQQNQTAGYTGGNAYTTPGASGEYGAYQFMPNTWKDYAGQILNDPNAPMTPENQDKVAQGMVAKWLADGKTPEQIAIKWNHGDFSYTGTGKGQAHDSSGKPVFDAKGNPVMYDIPGYVAKFKANLASLGGGNDASTVAKAIKLTETGGAGDVAVERAVNVINGSNKFTKDQKNSFISSMNNAANVGDAFTVIKNQAREAMTGTTATKLENYENANAAMNNLVKNLNDYYTQGGDTNIFTGTYENALAKLGAVDNPNLRMLAAEIESSLQIYRNAVSGTAYSVQEGQAIASIFPGIDKTKGLNDAILKARQQTFNTQIDAYYKSVLGNSYDEIKSKADIASKTTGDVLNEQSQAQISKLKTYYADPAKKADIDSKISQIETKLGRKISMEEFLQAYPSYGN